MKILVLILFFWLLYTLIKNLSFTNKKDSDIIDVDYEEIDESS